MKSVRNKLVNRVCLWKPTSTRDIESNHVSHWTHGVVDRTLCKNVMNEIGKTWNPIFRDIRYEKSHP